LFDQNGTWSRPAVMPMDAYRDGEQFVVQFDLPGVDPSSIDLNVEHNVLTVKAERASTQGEDVELQVAERPRGVFSRQLFLGETLDTDRIEASYDVGVLTLRIPIAEKAKPPQDRGHRGWRTQADPRLTHAATTSRSPVSPLSSRGCPTHLGTPGRQSQT
jgi:HSP20 family protein